jgi:hypothetical protein
MSNEVTTIDNSNINLPMALDQILAQKSLIRKVMESVMKEGTHYGIIPGCKQPSLYKAGSEAALLTFRIAVNPHVEDLSTHDCFRYRVTCQGILPSGEIVGAGIGECSTDEEKYMWRAAVCPEEFEATLENRRRVKWQKGWKEQPAKPVQQVRTNFADLANTVLKMAKKRAQIDLTLTCTACSDVFVQDLEDLSEELRDELVGNENTQQRQGKPEVKAPESKNTPPPQSDGRTISEAQGKMIFAKLKNKGISVESFCAHYKIKELKDLPFSEVNPSLKLIDSGEIAEVAKTETKADAQTNSIPGRCVECGGEIVGDFCSNKECIGYRSDEDM